MGQETITLTEDEWNKVRIVEKILEGHLTNGEGAAYLGLTTRQVIRLKKKYLTQGGAQALAHRNRGRKPAHAIPEEVKNVAAALYVAKYNGSNHCHFAELLAEHEAIQVSPSSVRRILLAKGIKQAKQRRRGKTHSPRQRKAQAGMLWQIDATPYAWLEDRAPAFALHAAIDDATGLVVGAVFRPTECREGYSVVMQQGIQTYGVPLGLYSDRHTIFRSPNEKLTIEQELAGESKPLSHFGKAVAELRIEHIKAITPQAKGRVERLWRTLQDRLVIELRLLGIQTMEEANDVLPSLIEKHNRKFAVAPRLADSAYLKLHSSVNLDLVFTVREYRKLGTGHTLSYNGKLYTFAKPNDLRLDARTTVEVRETLAGDVFLWYQNQPVALSETEKPHRQATDATKKASSAPQRKPASHHPWKATDTNKNKRTTKSSAFQEALYSQHNTYHEAFW
jgi:Integrase core domain.